MRELTEQELLDISERAATKYVSTQKDQSPDGAALIQSVADIALHVIVEYHNALKERA